MEEVKQMPNTDKILEIPISYEQKGIAKGKEIGKETGKEIGKEIGKGIGIDITKKSIAIKRDPKPMCLGSLFVFL